MIHFHRLFWAKNKIDRDKKRGGDGEEKRQHIHFPPYFRWDAIGCQ